MVVATDGMNAFDFEPESGKHVSKTASIDCLLCDLRAAFRQDPNDFIKRGMAIRSVLEKWISLCQSDDDATLAVLLSPGWIEELRMDVASEAEADDH